MRAINAPPSGLFIQVALYHTLCTGTERTEQEIRREHTSPMTRHTDPPIGLSHQVEARYGIQLFLYPAFRAFSEEESTDFRCGSADVAWLDT